MSDGKPPYVDTQAAFHRAFQPELRKLVDGLPVDPGSRVLDVPCGYGFYTEMLSERSSNLVAVDSCEAHILELEQKLPKDDIRCGDAYKLQEQPGSFDVIWCAESLISLEPKKAVNEFARLLHERGLLVILEVDEYHHVMLSWPASLESALPLAIHQASLAKYGSAIKLSPARRLRRDLRHAGFNNVTRKLLTFGRHAPYGETTFQFLAGHFDYLRKFLYTYLPKPLQVEFDVQTDPQNPDSLFYREDSELTVMNAVYFARKPVSRSKLASPRVPRPPIRKGMA